MKNNRLYMFITSRSVLLRIRNVSDKSYIKSQNTYLLCSITFFRSCRLCENMDKYRRTGQATGDNMAHAHRMLDTHGYENSLRIYNTCWFSTATMVARKRVNVMLYVQCPYCYFLLKPKQ
jgi:hypothetical protein